MTKGEKIRQLRQSAEMTQEELATRLGVTKQTIFKYENGIITNIPSDNLEKIADIFKVSPAGFFVDELPSNVSVPAAHAVPILGTVCCGSGIDDKSFDGVFFVDHAIRADYCLHVKGDSMIDAHIFDGDIAFLTQDYDFEDGKIYACVIDMPQGEAMLKKVFRADDHLILQPCSSQYKAIVCRPEDCYIVGKLAGVYHKVQ